MTNTKHVIYLGIKCISLYQIAKDFIQKNNYMKMKMTKNNSWPFYKVIQLAPINLF